MISPKIQADEAQRVKALEEYRIANTPAEKIYSELARLAQLICKTEVSLISFIDDEMQWFKAHPGTEIDRNTREFAICSHCITIPDRLMYIPDLSKDPILKHNPMVTGPTHVRFYAGIPLLSHEGYAIGTICVMDTQPQELNADQREAIVLLRNQVMELLEQRRFNHQLQKRQESLNALNDRLSQFASAVSHDIKSPINNLKAISDTISSDHASGLSEELKEYLSFLSQSSGKLTQVIEDILGYHRDGTQRVEAFDLKAHILNLNSLIGGHEHSELIIQETGLVQLNKPAMTRVLSNLLTNSYKFCERKNCTIEFTLVDVGDGYEMEFKDNGPGIPKPELKRVFDEFYRGSSNNAGSGLGLAAVRQIINNLGGSIRVDSAVGQGTTFHIHMPKLQSA